MFWAKEQFNSSNIGRESLPLKVPLNLHFREYVAQSSISSALRFPRPRSDQPDFSHLRFFHLNQQQLTTISTVSTTTLDSPTRHQIKRARNSLGTHAATIFKKYGLTSFIISILPLQSSSLRPG